MQCGEQSPGFNSQEGEEVKERERRFFFLKMANNPI
jgi:hypothetical protein